MFNNSSTEACETESKTTKIDPLGPPAGTGRDNEKTKGREKKLQRQRLLCQRTMCGGKKAKTCKLAKWGDREETHGEVKQSKETNEKETLEGANNGGRGARKMKRERERERGGMWE